MCFLYLSSKIVQHTKDRSDFSFPNLHITIRLCIKVKMSINLNSLILLAHDKIYKLIECPMAIISMPAKDLPLTLYSDQDLESVVTADTQG
jgi:hypothetical protein